MPKWQAISLALLRLGNALLLALVLLMGVRSYWVQDNLRVLGFDVLPGVVVRSGGGELLVRVVKGLEISETQVRWRADGIDGAGYLSGNLPANRFGFGVDAESLWPAVVLPWWAIALPLSAWPIWWLLWDRMRWQRLIRGRCAECGYDLREATDSICPECGADTKSDRRAEFIAKVSRRKA